MLYSIIAHSHLIIAYTTYIHSIISRLNIILDDVTHSTKHSHVCLTDIVKISFYSHLYSYNNNFPSLASLLLVAYSSDFTISNFLHFAQKWEEEASELFAFHFYLCLIHFHALKFALELFIIFSIHRSLVLLRRVLWKFQVKSARGEKKWFKECKIIFDFWVLWNVFTELNYIKSNSADEHWTMLKIRVVEDENGKVLFLFATFYSSLLIKYDKMREEKSGITRG